MKFKTTLKTSLILNFAFFFCSLSEVEAQNIGINGSGANAHPSALLDVDAVSTPSLGILIPRIALQAINLAAPVTSPATSLLVYNTASASTGTNAVSAGYYYWDGIKWVRFAYSPSGVSANDWNTLGNSGTVDGTNFIGTTDNVPFNIRVNNLKAGRIDHVLANTFFGVLSGNANTTGSGNTAIGAHALQTSSNGMQNTAIGTNALQANTTGSANVSVGYGTLPVNTTGYQNTGLGTSVLRLNTTGYLNTASGLNSLEFNISGRENTAYGASSLWQNITGNENTGIGNQAIATHSTGVANTAMGFQTLSNLISGNNNVAIGHQAGVSMITGTNNLFVGKNADVIINNLTNATAIGYNAKVGSSNALVLGGTGTDAVNVGIGTTTPANRFTIETGDMQLGEAMLNTGLGRRLYFSDIANSTDPIYFQRENIALDNSHLNLILGDNNDGTDKFNVKNSAGNTFLTVQNNSYVGVGTTTPNSNLHVNGSVSASIVRVTGNYVALDTDYTIVFNTTANATLTLPAASTCTGRIYNIVSRNGFNINFNLPLVGSNGNTTTIVQNAAGGSGYSVGDKVIIQSDGTDWVIISW